MDESGTSSIPAIRSAAFIPHKNLNTVGLNSLQAPPPCTSDIAVSVPSRAYTPSCILYT